MSDKDEKGFVGKFLEFLGTLFQGDLKAYLEYDIVIIFFTALSIRILSSLILRCLKSRIVWKFSYKIIRNKSIQKFQYNTWSLSFSRWIKVSEILGILIAVIAILQEFKVEKPRDRALRHSQLFTQFAELASVAAASDEEVKGETGKDEKIRVVSLAIRRIVELLAEEDVAMSGMVFPAGINLSGVKLTDADLTDADLTDADLSGANLTDATLTGTYLGGATLTGAIGLTQKMLNKAQPSRPPRNLPEGLSWRFAPGADLTGADLIGAHLSGAELWNAELTDADLWNAKLINADLSGAELWNAKLINADLSGAELWNAKLINADLSGAKLTNVKFTNAKLINADLSGAELWNAKLARAILSGANFTGAYLGGADLDGVTGLMQEMLDKALPSRPPRNLPAGLFWPFEEGADGEWRLR